MTSRQLNVSEPTSVGRGHDGRAQGPRRMGARDLALVAAFAAFIIVLALPGRINAFGNAVPITLQSLGICLASLLLGARRSVASILLVLLLCAVGLPVMSGGTGGFYVLVGPGMGYIMAWIPAMALMGAFAYRTAPRFSYGWAACGLLVGNLVIHAGGILGMAARLDLPLREAFIGDLLFVPGDIVKAVIALVLAGAVHRAVPDLLARAARR